MSASSFKDQGNKHLQAGEYDLAVEAYTKAISIDPSDHVFYSNRSAAYLSKGDSVNALNDAEKCIQVNPTWPKGYSRKGAALHALKRWDEAVASYESGLSIAPSDTGLKSGLSEVQKAKESSSRPQGPGGDLFGPQLISKLVGHPKFGPRLADPAFMRKLQNLQTNPQLIMQDPEMMEVLQVMLGGMGGANEDDINPPYESTKPTYDNKSNNTNNNTKSTPMETESDEKLSEEEKAQKELKKRAIAAKDKGNALYKEKKFLEAIAAYDEAISIDKTNITFYSNKAAVYIEMGDTDKAIELCNEAIELGTHHRASYEDKAKVYQRVASAYLKKSDIPAAIKSYEKAQMENFDKAIERKIKNLQLDFKKLQQESYINPELAEEAKERGNKAFRESNFPEAIKEYEEAVKRAPKNPSYRNNLAASYLKMGLFNDAKREIERCIEIDRNYVKAWAKKGDIEFFMKEYHKALDSYRAGLQIEPDNSLCKQGLQKTLEKINTSQGPDSERTAHAMADPEIQSILNDPVIRNILSDMQENPNSAQKAMADPIIRAKIEKLIASGVLQVR
eukprot:CAMPEP_0196761234 /NCGR_PEP_ID=MMETSP1095-20130614/397_1 /TAXON_ID=96789 ORGANISM="Chromulina nebulosa, Strain UTEXLB2642" /NCGR_SAMPLE_ID=MMETSP1095 /ASSEMBLY_ACC=CAM_ASM_000446 /LENGTH=561 /DNA_ID=CAMNT_0042110499 /DNA_START=16 /DNA_END=1701 /DNA_ORIENTATION=-